MNPVKLNKGLASKIFGGGIKQCIIFIFHCHKNSIVLAKLSVTMSLLHVT